MDDLRILYVTVGTMDQAEQIASSLVEEQLAACANILPAMRSCYRWQGAVQFDDEVVLIVKTSAERCAAATQRILELHTYELPCVIELPMTGGHAPFLAWIHDQLAE